MAASPKYLKDIIKEKSKGIFDLLYHNYRPDLDSRVTIVDLSYESLKVNLEFGKDIYNSPLETYEYLHETLLKVVKEKMPTERQFTDILDPKVSDHIRNPSWTYFLIDGGKDNFFIVANGIESGTLRKWLTTNISKDARLINTDLGVGTVRKPIFNAAGKATGSFGPKETRTRFDIGHISSEGSDNLTSPLEEKIIAIVDFATKSKNTRVTALAQKSLKRLYDIQAEFSYVFKNVSQENIAAAQRVLGKGYVVVTLHTQVRNNQFAKLEKQIYDELQAGIGLSLVTGKGSNSILDDISQNFADIIEFGKTIKKGTSASVSGKTEINLTKKVGSIAQVGQLKVNKTINIANKEISLASLQILINNAIGERIANNMGTGDRQDILNFRSGRFASTVEVERMSVSREGMITAFYRYMKYPYATFEPEGRQGLPKSRNPKLLISKSIREIAANVVGNRMRTVSL